MNSATNENKESQSLELQSKIVLVTGASSGIGRATAVLFSQRGARVFAVGRNQEALEKLQSEINCEIGVGDLTTKGECERLIKECVEKIGGITTLVNNAGVLRRAAMDTATLDDFDANFNANTKAVFEMMHYAIPHLKQVGEGASIVNVSSVNGIQAFAGVATYCASKAACDMLTKCAAVDLAPFKIRVNSVNPGVVVTSLQSRSGLTDEMYQGFLDRSMNVTHPLATPRQELPQPEDVAELICFLASDKARWITGDNVKIDAARTCLGAR